MFYYFYKILLLVCLDVQCSVIVCGLGYKTCEEISVYKLFYFCYIYVFCFICSVIFNSSINFKLILANIKKNCILVQPLFKKIIDISTYTWKS